MFCYALFENAAKVGGFSLGCIYPQPLFSLKNEKSAFSLLNIKKMGVM